MNQVVLVIGALASLWLAPAAPLAGNEIVGSWPAVSPLARSFRLVDHDQQTARLSIDGVDASKLYFLECHLNAYEYGDDPAFNYSGDFECRLTSTSPLKNNGYPTLLTDEKHPTRDWHSRGRFLLEEFTGRCASYPEWGAVRHFRLRGMELTLSVSSVKVEEGSRGRNQPWNTDRIASLDFSVEVVPDPKALSGIAEPTEYAEPPFAHPGSATDFSRNCETVVLKKDK